MKFPRFQFSLRKLLFAITFCAIVAAYGGSYYRVSRQRLTERPLRDCVLFVTDDELQTETGRARHERFKRFFWLARWVDRQFTDVPSLAIIDARWSLCELNEASVVLVVEYEMPDDMDETNQHLFPQCKRFFGMCSEDIIFFETESADDGHIAFSAAGHGPQGGSNESISIMPDWVEAAQSNLCVVPVEIDLQYKRTTYTSQGNQTTSQQLIDQIEVLNREPAVIRQSQDIRFAAALVSPGDVSHKLLAPREKTKDFSVRDSSLEQ